MVEGGLVRVEYALGDSSPPSVSSYLHTKNDYRSILVNVNFLCNCVLLNLILQLALICYVIDFMDESNILLASVTKKMLQEGVHADVTLKAGDGGTAKAHRCILATRSPVFEAMFRSNMKERKTSVVELQDMKVEVVKLFLLVVYCGFDEFEDEAILDEHWKEVFGACHKYEVPFLHNCARFMQRTLVVSNCWDYLRKAITWDPQTSSCNSSDQSLPSFYPYTWCAKLQSEAGPLQIICLDFMDINFRRISVETKILKAATRANPVLVAEVMSRLCATRSTREM